MIPTRQFWGVSLQGKPRASGDDPTTEITVQLDVW